MDVCLVDLLALNQNIKIEERERATKIRDKQLVMDSLVT